MTRDLGVGIIGCGNISTAYLRLAPIFRGIDVRACADLNLDAAKAQAEAFGVEALSPNDLMSRDDIEIVVNLTIPAAHAAVSEAALNAGKHVYSEKPFVLDVADGKRLLALAEDKGLRIGSAPDTILGGAHQLARHLIDQGDLGTILSGTAVVQGHGMESWHPNPDFFFQPGAGPVLDIGPYYISNLVQLLGPVSEVMAMSSKGSETRVIGNGPREGEEIPVDTPTTIHALLRFRSGAQITLLTSWDVWAHSHGHMELYGSEGSMFLPDPNFFGGDLRMTRHQQDAALPDWDHPFGQPNEGERANYRVAGLADMAAAIEEGREHRCNGSFALHVVDVMTSILTSGETNAPVALTTTCDRPSPLGPEQAMALLKA